MEQKISIPEKSPIHKVWDIARLNINLSDEHDQPDTNEVKREIARVRSKIEKSGIGDRTVYDESRPRAVQ